MHPLLVDKRTVASLDSQRETMLGLLISVLFNTVSLLTVLVVCTLLAGLTVLLKSDCDLTLKFYERFGKRPDKGALRGKVVWITGASSGIGAHLAYALAACGARLVLSSRKERDLRKVLEKCKGEVKLTHRYHNLM